MKRSNANTPTVTGSSAAGSATDGNTAVMVRGGDYSQPHHGSEQMPPEAAFFLGMIAGAIIFWLIQRGNRAKAWRHATARQGNDAQARIDGDIGALARRTATLERIVTDRAARIAQEIETLR